MAWPWRANVAEAVTQEPRAITIMRSGAVDRSFFAFSKSAAPRSGVSDHPNSDALPPKLPKLTKFIKLIEPRARRASPQGHGKSLLDTVKNIDFASVLEGFRPNPSKTLRPRRETPVLCKNSNLRYCGSI